MAYNMYDIGPARYQGMQQQRKDEWFRMMMNMFLMSKRMKMTKEEQQQEQQRWEAMQPYYRAREQLALAQAERTRQPSLPSHVDEYLWWRRLGLPDKEAMGLVKNIKPEQKSATWKRAKEEFELGFHPNMEAAYKAVLTRERQARQAAPPSTYRVGRDEKSDFESFLETAIEAAKVRGTLTKDEVDEDGQPTKAGQQRLDNVQKVVDELRRIQGLVQLNKATQADMAKALEMHGNLERIGKEGFYWEKDKFGYKVGEIREGKGMYKGKLRRYVGNNQWETISQ